MNEVSSFIARAFFIVAVKILRVYSFCFYIYIDDSFGVRLDCDGEKDLKMYFCKWISSYPSTFC